MHIGLDRSLITQVRIVVVVLFVIIACILLVKSWGCHLAPRMLLAKEWSRCALLLSPTIKTAILSRTLSRHYSFLIKIVTPIHTNDVVLLRSCCCLAACPVFVSNL